MKKLDQWLRRPWAAYTFALCAAVALYLFLSNVSAVGEWLSSVWKLLSPVVVGIITAYLLNPVAVFFETRVFKKLKTDAARHALAVILTVVCLVLFVLLLLVALIPSLVQSISKIVANWNDYTDKVQVVIEKGSALAARFGISFDSSNLSELLSNAMDKLVGLLKNNVKTIMSTVSSIGSGVSNFFVGVVFGVCFLFGKKSLLSGLDKLRRAVLRQDRYDRNNDLLRRCHRVFIRYLGCTLLDAVVVGVATLIFMLIFRMPYAALLAAVVGITNIIPTFGPIIGNVIGVFFLVLDQPLNALWFFVFLCVLQSLNGAVIKPKLFSDSLGIPAIWTLVLIILGGKIAGMLGILLAIPFAAILAILYRETFLPRLEARTQRINAQKVETQNTEQ